MAVALVFTLQLPLRAQHRAPNVALASLGASAEASSQFDPVLSPANAINGTWHTWASSWSSGHGMPQWLTVTLKQPQTVQAVRIHADERPELRFELRDYTVDVRPPGTAEWRTVARVTGNTAAHRLDAFPPVQAEAVRLTVTATGGGDDVVRMNEIEVFGLGELPETQTAFAVGAIDGQYSEFAIAGDYAQFAERFPDDVTVDLAGADAASTVPYILPGPQDGWAGAKPHCLEVRFPLDHVPAGEGHLLIALVGSQGQYGQRQRAEINGEAATVVFPPQGTSDGVLSDPGQTRPDWRGITFSTELLRPGENTIRLTSVGGSWAVLDGITLTLVEGESGAPRLPTMSVEPTPLLKDVDGRLMQALRVVVTNRGRAVEGTLESAPAGGKRFRPLSHVRVPFGETARFAFIKPVEVETQLNVRFRGAGTELSSPATIRPPRKMTLYIAPSVHTDIGYTHLQQDVYEVQAKVLDDAVRFCEETATYPDDARFRWNLETAWQVDNYRRKRGEAALARVMELVRQGRMEVSGLYLNMLSALCGHDELCELTARAREVRERYSAPVACATTTDNPTYTWAYPGLLNNSGIRYLAMGCNETRGPFISNGGGMPPIWWQGYDGQKVLMWFANGYAHASSFICTEEEMEGRVLSYLAPFSEDRYPYDMVLAYGGFGDNSLIARGFCDTVRKWNEKWAYPRLRVSLTSEFFRDLEARWGSKVPVRVGDMGDYWEDGAASSALETALSRQVHWQLPLARTLSTWRWLEGAEYPAQTLDDSYSNSLLYDEHTWGAYNSISAPEIDFVTQQFAAKAAFCTDSAAATTRLLNAAAIPTAQRSRTVLNPCPWQRSGPVWFGDGPAHSPGAWLWDVDALSTTTVPEANVTPPVIEEATGRRVFENHFYRLEVSDQTGAIVSLYDKEVDRELVDGKSPYGLNELIYDAGQPPNPVARATPAWARIESITRHPFATTLVVTTACGKVTSARAEITLYDHVKRIDIRNVLDKELTYDKEAVYLAFPFRVPDGTFRLQGPTCVTVPERDQLAGGTRDWYSVQDYVDISNPRFGVTWSSVDAPLVSLCDINTDKWLKKLDLSNQTIYSYIMNNYWFTNYKAGQGGRLIFRYSLTSHRGPYDAVAASHFGAEASAGLMVWRGADDMHRVVEVGDPRLTLLSIAPVDPSATPRKVVMRLWNVSDSTVTAPVRIAGHAVTSIREVRLTAEPVGPAKGAAEVTCKPRRVHAFELTLDD